MTEQGTQVEEGAPIPFVDLEAHRAVFGPKIDEAIGRVLRHGQFILGPEVRELELDLASWSGTAHAITCSSGTDALLLPLMAWEVGPGDAVFVPSFTFTATAEVVALLGATPVFCDVLPDTFNLDPDSLERAVDLVGGIGGLRPRAVMPVDLFGQPADYSTLGRVAASADLLVLADAAQSFGATLDRRRVGGFGDATATSFFPAKPLGCYGDGGAVFTDDEELAAVMRSLRAHGQGSNKYDTARIGLNARLDTIQAAVLLVKLGCFERELAQRNEVAERYRAALSGLVPVPSLIPGATSAWAQYTLRTTRRDEVRQALRRAGIPTAVYYPRPLHLQTAFTDSLVSPGGCPVSESLSEEVLSLPMGPYLRKDQQDRVITALRSSLGHQVRDAADA